MPDKNSKSLTAGCETYLELDESYQGVKIGDKLTIECTVMGVEQMPKYNYETDSYGPEMRINALVSMGVIKHNKSEDDNGGQTA